MSAAADKASLRARMRALRQRLAAELPEAARQAAEHLPMERLPAFAVIGGYHPLGGELDPSPLIDRLMRTGAMLALPVVVEPDAPLIFRAWSPGDPAPRDAIGVPSPPPSEPELSPDLVIAPLLAFDRQGGRLGQGGGYYDRTIAALRASRPVFVLGLAFAGQEVESIPMEPNDQRLDAILTETGYAEVG